MSASTERDSAAERHATAEPDATTTPADPDPDPDPDVATRLRAAGCVFAEQEARLLLDTGLTGAGLRALVERRAAGEPLEHVLGWARFHGHRVVVGPGVFVPRRRTEHLVDQAITLAGAGSIVLDLCCGSGAVGAAVRAALDGAELHAVDIDPAAVRVARHNLPGAQVYRGDLYRPLSAALAGRVDLVLVVAPYVPTGAIALMPPEARDHEPRAALDGGPDGLDVLRRILTDAQRWLAPGGHLLTELGDDQVQAALAECARHRLAARVSRPADGSATVLIAAPTTVTGR